MKLPSGWTLTEKDVPPTLTHKKGVGIMNKKASQFQNMLEKEVGNLVGGKIASLTFDPDSDEFGVGEYMWGLVVEKNSKTYTVWVLQDHEGNGPGALDISVVK